MLVLVHVFVCVRVFRVCVCLYSHLIRLTNRTVAPLLQTASATAVADAAAEAATVVRVRFVRIGE